MRSVLLVVVVLVFAAPALADDGCPKWMNAAQCQQLTLPADPVERALSRFTAIPLDQDPGEGCMEADNPPHVGCPHSYPQRYPSYWSCNGKTINCSIDYCTYDACFMSDCAQDGKKDCCGQEMTTTTNTGCSY